MATVGTKPFVHGNSSAGFNDALYLFDHFVGPRKHSRRNGKADLLGCFEVYDELEFGRLLNRQLGWPFASARDDRGII